MAACFSFTSFNVNDRASQTMMRTSIGVMTFVLCVALAPSQAPCEELPMAAPKDVGMSAEKLAAIDEAMQRRIEDGELVGGSVLVSRRGQVVYFKSFGLMDAEAKKPWRADTIARIYSMTKAITSAAVLMLVDDGKVAVDDPVAKFLPELAGRTVYDREENRPAKTTMTVRDLLRHTSGFIYGNPEGDDLAKQYEAADLFSKDKAGLLSDFVGKLSKLPLKFDPGTDWHYGVSTDVAGAVVERASGKTLDEFFRERIFEPLGMVDTGFEVPPEKLERFAVCYERKDNAWVVEDNPATSRYAKKATLYSGGGGLASTAADYWRFLMMIAGGGESGGVRLMKPETVALMTHNQLDDQTGWMDEPGQGFGLGFRVVVEPIAEEDRRLLGEYGWAGRASTHYWTNPRDQITVVTLEQTLPYSDKAYVTVQPLAYDAIVDEKAP
jgi:CubicO group peptidase (beta-lactamase class C family)